MNYRDDRSTTQLNMLQFTNSSLYIYIILFENPTKHTILFENPCTTKKKITCIFLNIAWAFSSYMLFQLKSENKS